MVAAPLRLAIEGALEISLAVLLQLRNTNNTIGCDVCGVVISGYLLLIYIVFSKVILHKSEVLETEKWRKNGGGLYDGYKVDNWARKSFLIWELLRRIIYVALLVGVTNYAE